MAILFADLVLLLHILFVVFAVCGGVLLLWRRWIMWLHLPSVVWAAIVEFYGLICPLTPLENWLRVQAGGSAYEGGFVARYIWPMLYPEGLTREIQVGLGLLVLTLNIVLYSWVWYHWRRQRSSV